MKAQVILIASAFLLVSNIADAQEQGQPTQWSAKISWSHTLARRRPPPHQEQGAEEPSRLSLLVGIR